MIAIADARDNFSQQKNTFSKVQKQIPKKIVFKAQAGRQSDFLSSTADIVFYGGAAGGGKTYGLLLDPLSHCVNYQYLNVAMFRKTLTDLKKPGALWPESQKIYSLFGAKSNNQELNWTFRTKSVIKMAGLQYEKDIQSWQGSQLDILLFDEVTHFTELQFWYLIGRLRSVTGHIRPYCRATCNPENNWVYELVKWWIKDDGYPDLEKASIIRWLCRVDDVIYWFDSKNLALQFLENNGIMNNYPYSFTFIPANVNDNQILLQRNPNYVAALSQLPEDEKLKLLEGNWLFRPKGKLFKVEWFKFFAVNIAKPICRLIACDTAHDTNSANDYSVMQVWTYFEGSIYLEKQIRGKFEYQTQLQLLEALILETNPNWVSIEKAATGHSLLQELPRRVGVPIIPLVRQKDKYTRGYECQPYLQSGYVYLNRQADYFTDFMSEISQFSPENKTKQQIHDDQVDCMLDAVYLLLIQKIGLKRQENENLKNYAATNTINYAPKFRRSVF